MAGGGGSAPYFLGAPGKSEDLEISPQHNYEKGDPELSLKCKEELFLLEALPRAPAEEGQRASLALPLAFLSLSCPFSQGSNCPQADRPAPRTAMDLPAHGTRAYGTPRSHPARKPSSSGRLNSDRCTASNGGLLGSSRSHC